MCLVAANISIAFLLQLTCLRFHQKLDNMTAEVTWEFVTNAQLSLSEEMLAAFLKVALQHFSK